MGDSDDEYDRRPRDKFARERDYPDRNRTREYGDRRGYQRDNYSSGQITAKRYNYGGRRDDYYNSMNKRSRIEFRLKYHPEESVKRKDEQKSGIRKRFEIFKELQRMDWIDKANVDFENARHLIILMNCLVLKLEGGSDEDVAILTDLEVEDDSLEDDARRKPNIAISKKSTINSRDVKNEDAELEKSTEEQKNDSDGGGRKKDRDEEGAISDTDSDRTSPAMRRKMTEDRKSPTDLVDDMKPSRRNGMLLHKTASIFLRNVSPAITIAEVETLCKRFPGFLRVGLSEPLPDRKFYRRGWVSFRRDVNIKEICWNLNNFRLRDCDMGSIVNKDLTRRVRSVNGVTMHKSVVQHDLRLAAKLVQLYDNKAGLFQEELVSDGEAAKTALPQGVHMEFGIESKNPLLNGITEFLIEEASAEEEELLGTSQTGSDEEIKVPLVLDRAMLRVLDRIVVYLRLVHSVDFYNCGEYPHEDEMPNRCGLIHVRSSPPSNSQWGADTNGAPLIPQQFLNEFTKLFAARLQTNLMASDTVGEDEVQKLGKKDPEKEVEAFITANSVELAKDKWLCPLSGKKFKGPEFVRKHLLSKHGEKLDEVRMEVTFFNNYLSDSKRPQNPEIKPLMSSPAALPSIGLQDDRRNDPDRVPAMVSGTGTGTGGGGAGGGYYRTGGAGGWVDRGGRGYAGAPGADVYGN